MFGIYKNIVSPGYSDYLGKGRRKSHTEYLDTYGINTGYYSSTDYIVALMRYAKDLPDAEAIRLIEESKLFFQQFTDFLINAYYSKGNQYPLSKEIYRKPAVRNNKCQTSILMIMTSLFQSSIVNNFNLSNQEVVDAIAAAIKEGFLKSRFPSTTSSTTEPKLLIDTIETIEKELSALL